MTERQLTFIDVDENSLVLWLKEDRVQLRVVDSRPELEAGELRAFASVLFAAYVGGPLVAKLEAACAQLVGVRDQLAGRGADEQIATLAGSLRAISEVSAAIAGVRAAIAPVLEPVAAPAPSRSPSRSRSSPASASPVRDRPQRPPRGKRAGEGDPPGWGWVRSDDEEDAHGSIAPAA
jgi:hypothetical protein